MPSFAIPGLAKIESKVRVKGDHSYKWAMDDSDLELA